MSMGALMLYACIKIFLVSNANWEGYQYVAKLHSPEYLIRHLVSNSCFMFHTTNPTPFLFGVSPGAQVPGVLTTFPRRDGPSANQPGRGREVPARVPGVSGENQKGTR